MFCLPWSGPQRSQGGFHLESRETLMKGGDQFGDQVILPGNASESALSPGFPTGKGHGNATKSLRTTNRGGTRLGRNGLMQAHRPEASVISSLKEDSKGRVKVLTSGGLHQLGRATLPKRKALGLDAAQDIFPPWIIIGGLVHRSATQGRRYPACPARPEDMIRRLHFNLTGLPPPDLQHTWRPLFKKISPRQHTSLRTG